MDTDPSSLFLNVGAGLEYIILSIVLLLLLISSALISGSEVAFFSLNPADREELENDKGKSSEITVSLLDSPKDLLATILIANNFINVAIVIVSSYLYTALHPVSWSPLVTSVVEVVVITFIILLIGEVIPKVYATRNGLKLALVMARPINFLSKLPPLSWMKVGLVKGTEIINRIAKKRSVDISTDDLEHALELTKDENQEEEHKILEGIVKFGNTDVRQIMCPRMDVIALSNESTQAELMELVLEAGFSRIPVFEESFDKVIGIIYVKDLLPYLGQEEVEWQKLLRTPFFVPENKKIDDLLKEFQEKKMHMAVVVDEYGGASGIVTLEDVLEEIVGDITDEYDVDDLVYTKVDDSTYVFEGKTPLVDLYKVLEIDGKSFEEAKGESDTIAGFVVEQAGKILMNNENIFFDNYNFVVESSDKKRVKMVKVVKIESSNG